MILETINGPEDIKHLDRQELETLAQEIREFLIEKISRTRGPPGLQPGRGGADDCPSIWRLDLPRG